MARRNRVAEPRTAAEIGESVALSRRLLALGSEQLKKAQLNLDLARVGLKAKLNYLQFTAFQQAVRNGKAPVDNGTWGSNSIPDTTASTAQFFTGGPDDQARDPEVIKGIAEADSQTDPEKRKALWAKVHQRIAAAVGAAVEVGPMDRRAVVRSSQGLGKLRRDVIRAIGVVGVLLRKVMRELCRVSVLMSRVSGHPDVALLQRRNEHQ